MKRMAGLAVSAAIVAGLSAWAGQPANAAGARGLGILARTERSSRLVVRGHVRCTATVRSAVHVGQPVSVKFVLHNLTGHAVTFRSGAFKAEIALKAADGTTYDSSELLAGLPGIPPPLPTKIAAGRTKLLARVGTPVRWRGPLEVTPECLGKTLPVLDVHVRAAGLILPDPSTAIDEVVAAAGHLLDKCRPQTPDFPVTGEIDPPSGNAPPLTAGCSISLSSEGRFLVAQVLVMTPPSLTGVQIFQPYETLWPTGTLRGLASSPPYEAIAWEFVVTREKAVPVAASSLAATNDSTQIVPFFHWTGSGWRQDGSASCGGTSFSWGGRGPSIEFIGACPA